MAVIHPPASRAGPDWGRGRSGVVAIWSLVGLRCGSLDRPNSRRPTSLYVPTIGRAWLLDPVKEVSGMRDYASGYTLHHRVSEEWPLRKLARGRSVCDVY